MQNKNITGKNIRKYRKLKNLTQEELTTKLNLLGLNVDRPMISKIESQARIVNDIELKYIAKVLEISILDLYMGVEK